MEFVGSIGTVGGPTWRIVCELKETFHLTTLLLALAAGQAIAAPTFEPRLLHAPAIHGDTLVFNYAGDLWVSDVHDGAIARRLTSAPGNESRPKISADGKTVAFTGSYEGSPNIYTIPIDGGEPKRLTYDLEGDVALGWTPDGKSIAYSTTSGSFTRRQPRLNLVNPSGGLPVRTAVNEVSELSYFADGHTMAYTRFNSQNFNWRRYRGGSQGKISVFDFEKNAYWELPSKREQSYYPMVVGRSIYFISDRGTGVLNLFRYDLDHKGDVQLTDFKDADIKSPSTDGKSIVFERDGYLYQFDLATEKTHQLAPKILSENIDTRPSLRQLAGAIQNFSLSPSGVRVAVEARGELFSVPVKQGDTRNITNTSGTREQAPQWSPDGQSIAYISDATGETELFTQPQLGGKPTQLTTAGLSIISATWSPDSKKILIQTLQNALYVLDVASKKLTKLVQGKYGIGGLDWSPDSRYIAYIDSKSTGFGRLFIADSANGDLHQVTDGYYSDNDVAWDLNGKYLYLASSRNFGPTYGAYEFSLKVEDPIGVYVFPLTKDAGNPLLPSSDEEPVAPAPGAPPKPAPAPPSGLVVKIDWDGLGQRLLALPLPSSTYSLYGAKDGVFLLAKGVLSKFDITTRETATIAQGIGNFAMNPARSKLATMGPFGLSVVDVHPGLNLASGRVDLAGVEAVIDPRDEWKEIFWEAWRYERDNFYDPTFGGQDWNAVGKHYAGYLQFVNSRSDLNYVIGLMLGELGTSHAYVLAPGDLGAVPRPIPVGRLGADYVVDGDHIKFAKIYSGHNFEEARRGPLSEPGIDVRPNDYLLEIDGKAVDAHTIPDTLLQDTVGKTVTLTVNSVPSLTGARKARVRPIASEAQLRYSDFVDGNLQMVDKLSSGRIGYMHISDTAAQGTIDFVKGFYPQTDKDAMIVDERWNSGGYIQPWFVDTLARKVKAEIQSRTTEDAPEEAAIDGPKVMLINGYAGSGGDFFPWMFRHAKLGPLIGKRTWGGLVGINAGANLVDGGSISSPAFSIFDPTSMEIIAENHGIDPDIDVDARPDLVAKGEDPQLETAIKYLMDKLKDVPAKKPRSQMPHVAPDGRIKGK